MLKVKDNVDLKELEKFGFKPKYDEDTGEIKEYTKHFVYRDNDKCKKEYICFEIYEFGRIIKKRRWCCGGTWQNFDTSLLEDCFYDLIKADLVEKV